MNTKKFLYAPAFFTALALIATSECLAIGAEGRTGQLARRVTVFRETQIIKDGPVMADCWWSTLRVSLRKINEVTVAAREEYSNNES